MSCKWFNPVHYPLVYDTTRADFEYIDYEAARNVCLESKAEDDPVRLLGRTRASSTSKVP